MAESRKYVLKLPMLIGYTMVTAFLAILIGAYSSSIAEFWELLTHWNCADQQTYRYLLMQIRLPRVVTAGAVGASLAISGAVIQGLFRNPLADPSLIGVNSGAMLFAVLSIVFLKPIITFLGPWSEYIILIVAAFSGGLITTWIVYRLSTKDGMTSVSTMLLAGIAITAFASSISGVFIYLSDDQQLRNITFWSLGSFAGSSWKPLLVGLPIILFSIWRILPLSRALNAIMLGEKEAQYLGIEIEKVKNRVIVYAAFLVGVGIALSGMIGFVGLVVPHFLRLGFSHNYKYLLPASAILGAGFLIAMDTLSRMIIAPAELPIGTLTALVGAPFFLWLLIQSRQLRFAHD
ncbi:MAG: iron ABC transporter permease [Bacteroidota bacterium]